MSVYNFEAIGTFRADLRRVENTLGARIDARAAASEQLLRDEIHGEMRTLSHEIGQTFAELRDQLSQMHDELRHHVERPAVPAHDDLRFVVDRLLALEDKLDALSRAKPRF